MFTGIVEEIGTIVSVTSFGNGKRISFSGKKVFSDLKVDDSIAINGVCQTVTQIKDNIATVEAVEETLRLTTFNDILWANQPVNLERAALPTTRLGGHLVQGHVDAVGRVSAIQKNSASTEISIAFPREFRKYIVKKGSITLDGVSLTVAKLTEDTFTIAVIPHTIENTVLKHYSLLQNVNLEFDIIGKYVENILGIKPSADNFLDAFIDQPRW